MIRPTRHVPQRYVWARYFVSQFGVAPNGRRRLRAFSSATHGYERRVRAR